MFVRLDHLTHRFAGQPALFEDLTLTLEPGVLVGLVGPSGSGKSTLLSILAGQRSPTSGTIDSQGIGRIGWILQNPAGSPRRTALDHVVFPLLLRGWERTAAEGRAMEILNSFALGDASHRQFRKLSGGEAQRVAFARAAAADFDVLLLDEPTAQLDPRTAHTVRGVIRGLVAEDRIVLLATHDAALRAQCDEVVEMGVGQ